MATAIKNDNVVIVKPSVAAEMLDLLLDADEPAMLWGAPGISKSQLVKQAADRRGALLIDQRLSLLSEVDLHGIPFVVCRACRQILIGVQGKCSVSGDGHTPVTLWAPPGFLPTEGLYQGEVILFFDEMNRALVSVMNSAFQIVLDRKLGDWTAPGNMRIVAACNRETDGGGVYQMPAGLRSRFTRIDIEPDVADWLAWAKAKGLNPITRSFIEYRPDLLHQFDPKAPAFPNPRGWEKTSNITDLNRPLELKAPIYAGISGKAAGVEYIAWERNYAGLAGLLPQIMADPATAPIPDDVAVKYAIAAALANRMTRQDADKFITYLMRMPPEHNVFAVRVATHRDESIMNTGVFITWAEKYGKFIVRK